MAAKTWRTPKDPAEIRDYGVRWTADIGDATIASSEWTVVDGTVVIVSDTFASKTTTVRLSGGVEGESATLHNSVVLSNGEEAGPQTCILRIRSE